VPPLLPLTEPPRITCFLVKIASRCNLNCDYCYVYQHADQTWRLQPGVMAAVQRKKLAERIGQHAQEQQLPRLLVVFHGGEPLLAGVGTIVETAQWVRAEAPSFTQVDFSIQTNGILLDEAALEALARADIAVSLSLDGPKAANDGHRLDHQGRSSYEKTEAALKRLVARPEVFAGLIAVIDPLVPPEELFEFFNSYAPPRLDFLLPDANYLRPPPGRDHAPDLYLRWLLRAFDLWFDHYPHLQVRLFDSLLNALAGLPNETDAFGAGDVSLLTVETNGSYHDLDVLKIVGEGVSDLELSLETASILQAAASPRIAMHRQLLRREGLAPECHRCPVVEQCGGGSVPHRYAQDGFNHPTVYCREMLGLISHARTRLHAAIAEERAATQENSIALAPESIDLEAYERPESSRRVLAGLLRMQVATVRRDFEFALDYAFSRDQAQREAIRRLRAAPSEWLDRLVIRPSVIAWTTVTHQAALGTTATDIGGQPIRVDLGYLSALADLVESAGTEARPYLHRRDPWLRLPFGTRIVFEEGEVAVVGTRLAEEALTIIGGWRRDLLEEIRSLTSEIQFIRDPEAHPDKIVSFSDNCVPGAVYVSVRQSQGYVDPYDLADSIIHEHRHQKLYLLQRAAPIVLTDRPLVRSPWRSDLRPPSGLFHAAFVFSHLLEFWGYWQANGAPKLRDRARHNVETARKNLAEAIPILKATHLSETGSRLVAILEDRIALVG